MAELRSCNLSETKCKQTSHPCTKSDVPTVSVNSADVGGWRGGFGGRGRTRLSGTGVASPALLHFPFLGRLDRGAAWKRLIQVRAALHSEEKRRF